MDKVKFKYHLDEATKRLIEFTETLCYNNLKDNYRYFITPNLPTVTKDDEHLNEKEMSVLKTWNKYKGQLLRASQVVDLFHHDNKVPLWIDMTIYEARQDLTVIDLFSSCLLREENELMHQGLPPFHLQVAIPPDILKVEIDGKFDVNWQKKLHDNNIQKGILTRLKQLIIRT